MAEGPVAEREVVIAAREAAAEWDLGLHDLELLSVSENLVFVARGRDSKRYVVRVHRPGYNSLAELRSEHVWVRALERDGFGVPHTHRSRDGEPYVAVRLGDGTTRHVGVIGWIDGVTLSSRAAGGESGATSDDYRAVGALLARMHNHSAAWVPPADFTRRRWDVDGFFGPAPEWGRFWEVEGLDAQTRGLFEAARDRLSAELIRFGQAPDRFGLIHADLYAANVIAADGALVAIDFDDCGFGWHLYDIAVAVFDQHHRADFADLVAATVAGYRTRRQLPDDHVEYLQGFLLLRALALVGWLADRPENDDGGRAEREIAATGVAARRYLSGQAAYPFPLAGRRE